MHLFELCLWSQVLAFTGIVGLFFGGFAGVLVVFGCWSIGLVPRQCHFIFVIILRFAVACGTGCTESPLEEVLAPPSVDYPDSGVFHWLLRLLARIDESCLGQPGVRLVVARLLVEGVVP